MIPTIARIQTRIINDPPHPPIEPVPQFPIHPSIIGFTSKIRHLTSEA